MFQRILALAPVVALLFVMACNKSGNPDQSAATDADTDTDSDSDADSDSDSDTDTDADTDTDTDSDSDIDTDVDTDTDSDTDTDTDSDSDTDVDTDTDSDTDTDTDTDIDTDSDTDTDTDPDTDTGVCESAEVIACNETSNASSDGPGSSDIIDSYPGCGATGETGNEYIYAFTAIETGEISIYLMGAISAGDLNLFLLADNGSGCDPDQCIAAGTSASSFETIFADVTAGAGYYIVVDGHDGASGSYVIGVSCSDTDTDTDSDSDTDTESMELDCISDLGGDCAELVNGCAFCPIGGLVNPYAAGCSSDSWCCIPYSPPTPNDCTAIGGVCAPASLECPTGWEPVWTSCDDSTKQCCTPGASCE